MKYFLSIVFFLISLGLTGCGIGGFWMNGNPNHSPTYPYGARWVKAGMTRESRLSEFMQCGGYENLREGFEIQPNQPTTDFFKGYNAHVTQVSACMRSKGYSYLEQCDARCLHP